MSDSHGGVPGTQHRTAQQDSALVRWSLITATFAIIGLLIVVPVVNVFYEALKEGLGVYWKNIASDPDTRHSMMLTLIVAPVAVVSNLIFGVAAAWTISRFQFPGR